MINGICEQFLMLYFEEKLRQLRERHVNISDKEWKKMILALGHYLDEVEETFSVLKEKEKLVGISTEEKKELKSICRKTKLFFEILDKILLQNKNNILGKTKCRFISKNIFSYSLN